MHFSRDLVFRCGVRDCRASDLRQLEWYGMYWSDRELIRRAVRRAARGNVRMLVADADGHPVGQIWIDLIAKAREGVAVLWALRIHPMFGGKGLGTQLIIAAEGVARGAGFGWTEVDVERGNGMAQKFYRRLGYARHGQGGNSTTSWHRPDGKRARIRFEYEVFRKPLVQRRMRAWAGVPIDSAWSARI